MDRSENTTDSTLVDPRTDTDLKIFLLHFIRFGPYHIARLKSVQDALHPFGWQVRGLQVCSSDATYEWDDPTSSDSLISRGLPGNCIEALFPGQTYESLNPNEVRRRLELTLDRVKPDGVAISGWASPDALACLRWCRRHYRTSIVMSETRLVDGNRKWWKEWVKSRRVRRFDAALVGAESHADYLLRLGMPRERIATGYNVVDNSFFRDAVVNRTGASVQTANTPANVYRGEDRAFDRPFLLASNRFVEIKNLHRGIEAFADAAGKQKTQQWNLCLLGDGPLRESLVDRCRKLGLKVTEGRPWDGSSLDAIGSSCPTPHPESGHVKTRVRQIDNQTDRPTVFFPGFQQIDALPEYYARAAAFFHPATSEPWGLVINEAMASGLPILASRNGGAAETLIAEGENGLLFDPADLPAMTSAMARFMRMPLETRQEWGQRSRELLEQRMPTSAFGEGLKKLLGICEFKDTSSESD